MRNKLLPILALHLEAGIVFSEHVELGLFVPDEDSATFLTSL